MEAKALKNFIPVVRARSVLLFISIVIFPFFSTVAMGANIGSITGTDGAVYYKAKKKKEWQIAHIERIINTGDSIKTGADGRARLELIDGSTLTIANNSELVMHRFLLRKKKRSAIFKLSTGKMRAVVSKFKGSTDIKVKTPTVLLGVRGTDFIIMNHGSANVLFGKEDKVTMSGDGARGVVVTTDEMTENTRGAHPITPIKITQGSVLESARAQLESITDVDVPVSWAEAAKLPAILARWNINYASYLADSKRYAEALDVLQIAIDLAAGADTKAEAYLGRGTIFARNLERPEDGLKEYQIVIDKYWATPSAENALFSAGMIYMDQSRNDEALQLFRKYLKEYPDGARRVTVESFIQILVGQ